MPRQTMVAGTTITAAWANANVRDQVVTPFANAAARASAVITPIEGMVSYLTDTDRLEMWDGATWSDVAHLRMAATQGTGDAVVRPSSGANQTTAQAKAGPHVIQAGSAVKTTSGGNVTITFPTAYTGGVYSVMLTPGDQADPIAFLKINSTTLAGVTVRVYDAAGVSIPDGNIVRIDWLVDGWMA